MCDKSILLAEDDPSHEALFRRALKRCSTDCHLDVVHDGAEAIDYLFSAGDYKERDPDEMPDLFLLDLKMPKMDGLQVLQVMRRVRGEGRLRFPPVVVLTSSDFDEDISDAYRLGAQSYICKPVGFDEFFETVDNTLKYWLGVNRPIPIHRVGPQLIADKV